MSNRSSNKKTDIMFIDFNDMEEEINNNLNEKGINLSFGSFGYSYQVRDPQNSVPRNLNGNARLLQEKDIIFINNIKNFYKESVTYDDEIKKDFDPNRTDICNCKGKTYFNPRNYTAIFFKDSFKKILNRGGIIVAFCGQFSMESYLFKEWINGKLRSRDIKQFSNYSWIPFNIDVNSALEGEKAKVISPILKDFFQTTKQKIIYNVFFENRDFSLTFDPLLQNINEDVISVAVSDSHTKGIIFLLPYFKDLREPTLKLLEEYLPEIVPELLPYFAKSNWITEKKYLLPEINELYKEKEEIKKEYEERIENIEDKIDEKFDEYNYLYNILKAEADGNFLVENIIKSLNILGFENVINLDEEKSESEQPEEDIQIQLGDELFIIEVKGINRPPQDSDIQQLNKYKSRRYDEDEYEMIHGILLVNHEKHKPPLERKNPAYTEEQIKDAIYSNLNLMTTWDLFKLIKLKQKKLLSFSEIKNLFKNSGLFNIFPSSWKRVGKVDNIFDDIKVAKIKVEDNTLNKDDKIVFVKNHKFFKDKAESIEIDHEQANEAKPYEEIGVKLKKLVPNNSSVYKTN